MCSFQSQFYVRIVIRRFTIYISFTNCNSTSYIIRTLSPFDCVRFGTNWPLTTHNYLMATILILVSVPQVMNSGKVKIMTCANWVDIHTMLLIVATNNLEQGIL